MKMFSFIVSLLAVTITHAEPTDLTEVDFEPCTRILSLAILNKDNSPYWAQQPSEAADVIACYNSVRTFSKDASEDEIANLENAFGGRIRIFHSDADFGQYLEDVGFEADVTVEESEVVSTQFPSFTPYSQTTLFRSVIKN